MTFWETMKFKIHTVEKSITVTFKLIWQFKWYAGLYLIYFIINIGSLLNIPTADDKIFNTEATSQLWYYTNQEVYVGSLRLEIIILTLLFLLGTSNIRNHPKIAKFVFILPWIYAAMHLTKLF